MVGTVKKNKPELPAEIFQVKGRAPLSSKFAFTDTTTVVSYCPKRNRNVILMSTLHKDAAVSSGSDKKPTIIHDYNKNKGGVDNLDKLTATYTCQRMTRRRPMVVFYNILDVSAYNALYCGATKGGTQPKKNKRRLFLEELGNSLVKPHIRPRCCSLCQTAAELTQHSIHTISNTERICISILLSQPCLNTD